MKTLIALAVIAAGALTADSKEVAIGQSFDVPDDLAAKLIESGQAKEDAPALPPASKVKTVKARLLVDSDLGKANDVADVPTDQLKQLEADGSVDSNKAAVAYAMSLKA